MGRPNLPGLEHGGWLEKNINWQLNSNINKGEIGGHYSLFTLPQKTLQIDLERAKIKSDESLKLEL